MIKIKGEINLLIKIINNNNYSKMIILIKINGKMIKVVKIGSNNNNNKNKKIFIKMMI